MTNNPTNLELVAAVRRLQGNTSEIIHSHPPFLTTRFNDNNAIAYEYNISGDLACQCAEELLETKRWSLTYDSITNEPTWETSHYLNDQVHDKSYKRATLMAWIKMREGK